MSTAGATGDTESLHRLHSAMNSGDLHIISKAVDDFVAPDVLFHAPVPMPATGAGALKRVWDVLLDAFPTSASPSRGRSRRATRSPPGARCREPPGRVPGPAARREAVTYSEISICRFADGRIAEIRGVVDVLAQLRRVGTLPA
ncbi:hypothetical protein GCM10023084_35750 [Streptomyces lacrimifluminis]|uniref:SnoaL-like domain-containing protein n=1 Tax=Streptomyces lacrimifluminis TaxID=1500077 RepID=A0A917NXF4_9ACTN|nr:nuclear transport factor 2 family protein [Streptomyces lacrimifluminis]GGJ37848.1 hypothetical protein GCM10012282_38200 [Streptomyces lacrimifluminis]